MEKGINGGRILTYGVSVREFDVADQFGSGLGIDSLLEKFRLLTGLLFRKACGGA